MSKCGPGEQRCMLYLSGLSEKLDPGQAAEGKAAVCGYVEGHVEYCPRHAAVDTLVKTLKVFLDGSVCGDRECDDCAAQYMMRDALRAAGEVVDD